jgi:hypothetical protein
MRDAWQRESDRRQDLGQPEKELKPSWKRGVHRFLLHPRTTCEPLTQLPSPFCVFVGEAMERWLSSPRLAIQIELKEDRDLRSGGVCEAMIESHARARGMRLVSTQPARRLEAQLALKLTLLDVEQRRYACPRSTVVVRHRRACHHRPCSCRRRNESFRYSANRCDRSFAGCPMCGRRGRPELVVPVVARSRVCVPPCAARSPACWAA